MSSEYPTGSSGRHLPPSASAATLEATSADDVSGVRKFVRGDRIAVAIYRFLESRSLADIRHVFNAARAIASPRAGVWLPEAAPSPSAARALPGPAAARIALARASLQKAAHDLGRVPSRRDYDRWREHQPRPTEFASATFIRRAFKSWVEATSELDGLSPDPTARRLLQSGMAFSLESLKHALALFAADVPCGKRTQRAYREWAHAYVRQPGALDVPLGCLIFTKRFEANWRDVLLTCTGENEDAQRVVATRLTVARARRRTPEEQLECLRLCARELGVEAPGTEEYNRWTLTALDRSGRRLAPQALTIGKTFGSWSKALYSAGLLTEEQFALYVVGPGLRLNAEEMLPFVSAALRDRGTPGTTGERKLLRSHFTKWRWSVMLHPEWTGVRIPSVPSILEKLGCGWDEVVNRAREVPPADIAPHLHLQKFVGPKGNPSKFVRVDA